MDGNIHRLQMNLLIESLDRDLRAGGRSDFFIGGNMALYYSLLQVKKNDIRGPDVFVVLGTEHRDRKSWVVWEEGGQGPDVIIELLSDSTAAVDRGEKVRIYGTVLGVPEYYIYDPSNGDLEGYRLDVAGRRYARLSPGPNGRLSCERLGRELGTRPGTYQGFESLWLRWFTKDGTVLPSHEEAEAEAERKQAALKERLAAYEQRFGHLPEAE
jgi:Uma2 family endonuclease